MPFSIFECLFLLSQFDLKGPSNSVYSCAFLFYFFLLYHFTTNNNVLLLQYFAVNAKLNKNAEKRALSMVRAGGTVRIFDALFPNQYSGRSCYDTQNAH